ncbi:putative RNA-binding protein 19 [Colletotrichum shisoi]|uniref:Putative RNA-binding protein 19 n=1 Tax=Colletotrichum shisoi TaxID=2078593 RepID=A0A5Q4BZQ6_9PEZI|nr:putative RNA-binding protein 19 [Colletotrichum shisoi]
MNRHSIRRAATRATLTNSVFAATVAPKSQTISSALRAFNATAVCARYFSFAAPKAFSRSAASQFERQQRGDDNKPYEKRVVREHPSEHVVFVQNYSFDVKPEDLTEAFSKYGEVAGVSMPSKKTYCFVYFKDHESSVSAVENVNGTFWHGRRIVARLRSDRAERPEGGDRPGPDRRRKEHPQRNPPYMGPPTQTLYIGNISYEASDADLNNLFATLTDVKDVRVAVDRATGWPRGFAHADFASVEAAKAGKEALAGVQLGGRELRISYAPGKDKHSTRDGDNGSGDQIHSQSQVEERIEAEHEQAEEAQKDQKPEAGKQDINWNA